MPTPDLPIESLRAGDESAWRGVMRDHGRLVLAATRRFRFSRADREEVFQNAWLAAFRSIGGLRDARRFDSWLYSIAWRASLDHLDRLRAQGRITEPSGELTGEVLGERVAGADPLPDEITERMDLARRVRELVYGLDERCRALLTALFLDEAEESYEEISRRTGVPVGSIGPTRARCLAKLEARVREVSPELGPPSTPPNSVTGDRRKTDARR